MLPQEELAQKSWFRSQKLVSVRSWLHALQLRGEAFRGRVALHGVAGSWRLEF